MTEEQRKILKAHIEYLAEGREASFLDAVQAYQRENLDGFSSATAEAQQFDSLIEIGRKMLAESKGHQEAMPFIMTRD